MEHEGAASRCTAESFWLIGVVVNSCITSFVVDIDIKAFQEVLVTSLDDQEENMDKDRGGLELYRRCPMRN